MGKESGQQFPQALFIRDQYSGTVDLDQALAPKFRKQARHCLAGGAHQLSNLFVSGSQLRPRAPMPTAPDR